MMKLVEIDIGKPPRQGGYNDNDGWLCSAVILPPYGEYLSHNDVSYWFNLDQYNIGGRIYKDSPEGEHIGKIIQDETSVENLGKHILMLAVKRLRPAQFIAILNWVREEAEKEGRNKVRRDLGAILAEEF